MSLLLLAFALGAFAADDADAEQDALQAQVDQMRADLDQLEQKLADQDASEVDDDDDDDGSERVAFSQRSVVAEGETVSEVVSFGDDVEVAGHVIGDAVSFGGDVIVRSTGRIDGDAVSFGGSITTEPDSAVAGDRVQMSLPFMGAAPAAGGSAPFVHADTTPPPHVPTAVGSVGAMTDIRSFFTSLQRRMLGLCVMGGTSVLVVALFPQRVGRVALALEERPVRAAAVGSLATGFLLVFGLLFVVVTLGLGLPITLLLYTMLGMAWLLGFVGLCQAIGDRLPIEQRPQGRWIVLLVGVFLLSFLGSLPWIGWLLVGAASVLGIGASITSRFGAA